MGKLTAHKVRSLTTPGRDGDGLDPLVRSQAGRSWLLRFTLQGLSREMGLGSAALMSRADARLAAQQARKQLRGGIDPVDARRLAPSDGAVGALTVRDVADRYVAAHEAG